MRTQLQNKQETNYYLEISTKNGINKYNNI